MGRRDQGGRGASARRGGGVPRSRREALALQVRAGLERTPGRSHRRGTLGRAVAPVGTSPRPAISLVRPAGTRTVATRRAAVTGGRGPAPPSSSSRGPSWTAIVVLWRSSVALLASLLRRASICVVVALLALVGPPGRRPPSTRALPLSVPAAPLRAATAVAVIAGGRGLRRVIPPAVAVAVAVVTGSGAAVASRTLRATVTSRRPSTIVPARPLVPPAALAIPMGSEGRAALGTRRRSIALWSRAVDSARVTSSLGPALILALVLTLNLLALVLTLMLPLFLTLTLMLVLLPPLVRPVRRRFSGRGSPPRRLGGMRHLRRLGAGAVSPRYPATAAAPSSSNGALASRALGRHHGQVDVPRLLLLKDGPLGLVRCRLGTIVVPNATSAISVGCVVPRGRPFCPSALLTLGRKGLFVVVGLTVLSFGGVIVGVAGVLPLLLG
mmetsp:Transcript_54187/g.162242  ORF Transcript_54187/g.162242 Transcript_54187/m.162242 type:complete len:441 (+) Transcript_54187:316-1638(+)